MDLHPRAGLLNPVFSSSKSLLPLTASSDLSTLLLLVHHHHHLPFPKLTTFPPPQIPQFGTKVPSVVNSKPKPHPSHSPPPSALFQPELYGTTMVEKLKCLALIGAGTLSGSISTALLLNLLSKRTLATVKRCCKKTLELTITESLSNKDRNLARNDINGLDLLSDEIVFEQLTRNIQFFGLESQRKVTKSFVVVIGLGGVRSHAAFMLLRSGVGRLLIVDFDQLGTEESKNLRDKNMFIVLLPNKAVQQRAQEPPQKKKENPVTSEAPASSVS